MNPRRVNSYENREVHGLAFCTDGILEDHLAEIRSLRDRQAEYLGNLPTDPSECIAAALATLHPDADTYPRGFEEALHLSCALAPMIDAPGYEQPGPEREALRWIAERIRLSLQDVAEGFDRVADILDNPARIEREARSAELRRQGRR